MSDKINIIFYCMSKWMLQASEQVSLDAIFSVNPNNLLSQLQDIQVGIKRFGSKSVSSRFRIHYKCKDTDRGFETRVNLDNREGQTDSTPVNKCYFTCTK